MRYFPAFPWSIQVGWITTASWCHIVTTAIRFLILETKSLYTCRMRDSADVLLVFHLVQTSTAVSELQTLMTTKSNEIANRKRCISFQWHSFGGAKGEVGTSFARSSMFWWGNSVTVHSTVQNHPTTDTHKSIDNQFQHLDPRDFLRPSFLVFNELPENHSPFLQARLFHRFWCFVSKFTHRAWTVIKSLRCWNDNHHLSLLHGLYLTAETAAACVPAEGCCCSSLQ